MVKTSIFRNAFSLFWGQGISLFINFIVITFIARKLGVIQFGTFSYIVAVVMVVSKIVDLGLSPIVFREFSKSKNDFRYLNSSITIRLSLLILVLVIFNLICYLIHLSDTIQILSNILFLNIIVSTKFQNIRELIDIPFKVSLKSHFSTVAVFLDNIFLLVLILSYDELNLFYVIVVYVICNIPGFLFLTYVLSKKFNFKFHFTFFKWKWLLIECFPILSYIIIMSLFQQVDLILLKNIGSEYSSGIYSAALRLSQPFMTFPLIIVSTVFPILVTNIGTNPEKNAKLNKAIYKILFFIAFTLAAIIGFKATEIITLIFGRNYVDAHIPLIFLLITQIFLFYNFYTINLLTAYNRQKKIVIYAFVMMSINIILNILLIPGYSSAGAGMAKLLSVLIGTMILFFIVSKEKLNFMSFNFRIVLWPVVLLPILFFLANLDLFFYLFIALLVTLYISIKIKFFDNEEILLFLKLINKEKWCSIILKI